jgi:dolichol-phosphate mannosyltransferase
MIPMLKDDVDMVTASPYHPDGGVRNVPTWRLFLSKRLSSLYRAVLGEKLHTYTSCFRIYRKSAVERLEVREDGFLGVAEMLGLVALEGGRIAECPAVLEVRLLGRSKMRVVKTMAGHLKLLLRLGAWRLSPGRRTASPASPNESEPARSSELRTIDRPNNRSGEVQ